MFFFVTINRSLPKFDKEIRKTCMLCVVPHHGMVGPPHLIGKGQQLASLKTQIISTVATGQI
jgi:hypothetical protein